MKKINLLIKSILLVTSLVACFSITSCKSKEDKIEEEKELEQYSKISDVKKDNVIRLGFYEQDGNLENGKEEVEWLVLDVSEDKHKILLTSYYVLDARAYNDEFTDTNWEKCSLRKWMNNEMLKTMFQDAIIDKIIDTELIQEQNETNTADIGNKTKDKMFILSNSEIIKYLVEERDRKSNATSFALSHNCYTSNLHATYWTRTTGLYPNPNTSCCFCDFRGKIYAYGNKVSHEFYGVRPCLFLEI